jgi:predicted ester cyclase
MKNEQHAALVKMYIEQIWNNQRFDLLNEFIHDDYRDYSLPKALTPDHTGLKAWIEATSNAFTHRTMIEEQVTEDNKSMIRIKMVLTHIGKWRNIEPTGRLVTIQGFRSFVIKDGKIAEHHALINGEAIESQLRSAISL